VCTGIKGGSCRYQCRWKGKFASVDLSFWVQQNTLELGRGLGDAIRNVGSAMKNNIESTVEMPKG
jgi:hypothetical protein